MKQQATNPVTISKRDIGKYVSFDFAYVDATETYSGYLVDYNDEWLLLKHNVVDYVMDGYIILRRKYVLSRIKNDKQRFTKKILDLKGYKPQEDEKIPLDSITTILSFLTAAYGVFHFDMRSSSACWLGNVRKITGSELHLNYLSPKAKWTTEMSPYKMGNIRTICFDTDYINSLMLVAGKKK